MRLAAVYMCDHVKANQMKTGMLYHSKLFLLLISVKVLSIDLYALC